MSITAAELIVFGSANRPVDDTSTSGGAIDATSRPTFAQIAATDNIEVLSSAAGDTTQTVTLTGRNAAGEYVSDVLSLNGVAVITSTVVFERLLKARLSATCAGNITVRRATGDTLLGTIIIGEREFYANFIKSASDTGAVSRYEKVFAKNTNGSLTLNDADITLTADPDSRIKIALEASKGGSSSIANRLATTGLSFSDDNVVLSVPTGLLATTENIGIWIEQALLSADAAFKSSYTLRIRGTSV
jgi:hypothetical protein